MAALEKKGALSTEAVEDVLADESVLGGITVLVAAWRARRPGRQRGPQPLLGESPRGRGLAAGRRADEREKCRWIGHAPSVPGRDPPRMSTTTQLSRARTP